MTGFQKHFKITHQISEYYFQASYEFKRNLTLCLLGNFSMLFCRLLFFQIQLFRKILSGIPSECQTVWIQIRPNLLLGLIWVQTVCESYQQTTPVGEELSPVSSSCKEPMKSFLNVM